MMKLHPLLTKNANKHYDKGGKSAIEQLEDELTVCEMIGACKFNIGKYTIREKGQNESDSMKAEKYSDYLEFLKSLPENNVHLKVTTAMRLSNIEFSYEA